MTATAPDVLGCDTSDMLTIHALFRRAFTDAPLLVRGVAQGDLARARVVLAHVRESATSLHHHHETEDLLLWDTLEQRAPACALHVGRMRGQHEAMATLLVRLDETLPAWEQTASAPSREEVASALDEVRDALLTHLGDEEGAILPTAATVMSQREWGALHARGMASVPKSRLFLQLGWILEVVPPDERDGWLATNLPAPARLAWRTIGRRQFARHRARIYGSR